MNVCRTRFAALLLVMLCATLIVGCAGKQPAESFTPPAGGVAGTWMFRHAAILEFPGTEFTLPFTGVMRLNQCEGKAQAVVLSNMGMTLLDMAVDADGHTTGFMHPSLSRLPNASENAATVIRYLWLGRIRPGDAAADGVTVLADDFSDGWAKRITLNGKRFVLRVTLVEARHETK